jgi:hypothetical protein
VGFVTAAGEQAPGGLGEVPRSVRGAAVQDQGQHGLRPVRRGPPESAGELREVGRLDVRDEVVIATKLRHPMRPVPNGRGLSRKAIMTEVEHSLRRLGIDYIDLYQIHRNDHTTPWEETLEALHDLVKAGKVRYLGASSMHAWEFAKALHLQKQHGWARFVSMQNHYNLLAREQEHEMIPLCLDEGVGTVVWSPLARGRLARAWDDAKSTARAATDGGYADSLYSPAEETADRRGGRRPPRALHAAPRLPGRLRRSRNAADPGQHPGLRQRLTLRSGLITKPCSDFDAGLCFDLVNGPRPFLNPT